MNQTKRKTRGPLRFRVTGQYKDGSLDLTGTAQRPIISGLSLGPILGYKLKGARVGDEWLITVEVNEYGGVIDIVNARFWKR